MANDRSSDCPSANGPKLLERVRDALAVRHYSPRTAEAYVAWIRRFIVFHNRRHPAQLGCAEVSQFLSSLAVKGGVSASTQNQALAAMRVATDHLFPSTNLTSVPIIRFTLAVNEQSKHRTYPNARATSKHDCVSRMDPSAV